MSSHAPSVCKGSSDSISFDGNHSLFSAQFQKSFFVQIFRFKCNSPLNELRIPNSIEI